MPSGGGGAHRGGDIVFLKTEERARLFSIKDRASKKKTGSVFFEAEERTLRNWETN